MKNLGYVRKSCSNHPIITSLVAILIVAAAVAAIFAVLKMIKKEDDLFEDDWDLDDDEDTYVFSNDGEITEV